VILLLDGTPEVSLTARMDQKLGTLVIRPSFFRRRLRGRLPAQRILLESIL
jgi:hypothetical protein